MTGHLDADTLAGYREGLPGRRRSSRIRAHLAGCSQCSAMDRDLAEVTTLLAAAPAPRMPDELARRLQGVLAAESAARASQAATPASQAATPALQAPGASPDGARHPRTRTPRQRRVLALRVASATAVVAALAAGGFILAHSSGPANSGNVAGSPAISSRGSGLTPLMQPNESAGAAISGPGATVPVLHSGRNYLPASLAAQASAVLSGYSGRTSPGPLISPGAGSLNQSSGALQACVRRVTGGARPTLVDEARYQGQPAIVIVQAPADGRAGQVWVTGAACSATHPDLLAHTRLTAAS